MNLDTYEPCPGGLDKKIKFCCKELTHDLDSLSRKIDGGQNEAALGQVDNLLKKYPDRQCLWALKTTMAMRSGNLESVRQVTEEFRKVAPENPVALAAAAILSSAKEPEKDVEPTDGVTPEATEAVDLLQRSLAACGENIPVQVFDAVGVVAQRLLGEGQVLASREHYTFQAILAGESTAQPISRILQINQAPAVSLLLKQDVVLPDPPAGTEWSAKFEEAVALSRRGAWAEAAKKIEPLVQQHPRDAILLQSLALLHSRLAQNEKAVVTMRQLARLDGIDAETAIETEALANLIDPQAHATKIDLIEATFELQDTEDMLAKLQSDRRASAMTADLSQLASGDGPPPRAGFTLGDRPLPEASDTLKASDLPDTLGEVLLYGKETDRPARLVVIVSRGPQFEQVKKTLREIGDGQIEGEPKENVLGQVSRLTTETSAEAQVPPGTSVSDRARLMSERYQQFILDRWPDITLDVLDGKSAREAASDPKYASRVLAAILVLETGPQQHENLELYDQLRSRLGLPRATPITEITGDVRLVPLVRLARLVPEKLDDEQLVNAYAVAAQNGAWMAIKKLGQEIIKRPSLDTKVKKDGVYARLSQVSVNLDESVELIQQAQQAAVKQGESPARWKISELGLQISRSQAPEVQRLLHDIQTRHMKEPGIADSLMQLLARFGLIRPDGRAATAASAPAGGPPEMVGEPGIAGAAETMPAATAAAEEPKSKLWLPGMD